jgi:hypothetical protein
MDKHEARRKLIWILRLAYSGELAAALAYRGHAASVTDFTFRGPPDFNEGDHLFSREGIHPFSR